MGTHPIFESDFDCLTEMAEAIKELSDSQTYNVLQKKVDAITSQLDETKSADQLNSLCEVLELTGKVQHSVFSTISKISEENDSNILQTRLLPWLGNGFIAPNANVTSDTSLNLIKEKVASEKKLNETIEATTITENSLNLKIVSLEAQLAESKNETALETSKLEAQKMESDQTIASLQGQLVEVQGHLAESKNETDLEKSNFENFKNESNTTVTSLEAQLTESKNNTEVEKSKLEAHKMESSSTLLATEEEILALRKQLADSKLDLNLTQKKLDDIDNYDDQILKLKSEVRVLTREKTDLLIRIDDLEPLYPLRRAYLPLYRDVSPVRVRSPVRYRSPSPTRANITNDIRANRLITRYSTLFTHDRPAVSDTLRKFVNEEEMVRRIIFIAATEAFHSAKLAFRAFESRTRKLLLPIHAGPETLDEAVADYIVRNLDLYDVEKTVKETVRQMEANPIISYPAECDFTLLNGFIREVAKVAFEMQAVEPKINIAHSIDGELFSDKKYRRSFDSEYSAPLVAYYVWPALMDGATVVAKGEAFTKRGALLHSPRRSRSPSPTRRGRSPTRRKY